MKLLYVALFFRDPEGGYAVEVPDLPGCSTGGASLQEAYEMAVDAAAGWVLDELEDGKLPPRAREMHEVEGEADFKTYLYLDMEAYDEKYGKKSIRKNLTLPAWLATKAEKDGINFSEVLKTALLAQYGVDN